MSCKIYNCNWIDPSKIITTVPSVIYNNYIPNVINEEGVKVLFLVSEPEKYRNCTNKAVIQNKDRFDLILTWDSELLNSCSNARLFNQGNTWIHYFNNFYKSFNVSFLVGAKHSYDGYQIRHDLWNNRSKINAPHHFYNSKVCPIPNEQPVYPYDTKDKLFENISHHVAIENTKALGWFTEKLMDCFVTKTVPIYYGCSNIDKYFNTKGMHLVNNAEEIIDVINNKISINSYYDMLPAIEENYELQKEYNQNVNPTATRIQNIINDWIRLNVK
jgi:hypothetical protein